MIQISQPTHMAERFKITHEAEGDTFNLQMKNGNNLRFVKKNYLYTYSPSTLYKKTVRRMKQKRNKNKKHNMKTRSHTRSRQPVIGMSNLCLTHADANTRDPFNQSRFAGVPDSIGDPSDDETNENGTDANTGNDADDHGTDAENGNNADDNGTDADDNGTDADGNSTDYYDHYDANYFENM